MKWARREALRTLQARVRTALRWKVIFLLLSSPGNMMGFHTATVPSRDLFCLCRSRRQQPLRERQRDKRERLRAKFTDLREVHATRLTNLSDMHDIPCWTPSNPFASAGRRFHNYTSADRLLFPNPAPIKMDTMSFLPPSYDKCYRVGRGQNRGSVLLSKQEKTKINV